MTNLPIGTVTFLFTDIEGSTKLWQQYPAQMPDALAQHHAILRNAIEAHDGYVFQIIGDAFCAAFHTARDGLDAALAAQHALRDATWGATGAIRVRMALHTGAAEVRAGEFTSGEYVSGLTMSRVARLLSAGHGGQILLSLPCAELVRDHLPKAVTLADVGARRLKDLIRPEQIFQVCAPDLPADFAPLKTLDVHPHNLPVQLTSFIGREREMSDVKHLLTTTHLLTLTGAGGTGKTRLSLQVAADLIDEFADGVWFIELAPLADPGLIPQTVASVLGLREETKQSLMAQLSDYLRAKTALLLLDNCEHLIEACAKFTDAILRVAPKIKILATSREALGIAGETAYRVPSLSLPPAQSPIANYQSLNQYEAVRLFIDRALAAKTDFAVTNANAPAVAQICHRLDGIPLAIELAAARVRSLSVEQIAARLDDRFRLLTGGSRTALPRQQTLRALIDWSYSLLSDEERVLLRRLSVFAGGWTLEAAQAVCSCDPVCADDVLDLLVHLVDKSLVVFEQRDSETRYRMLETIRQYARDRLLESSEGETIRDRHLDFFVAYAEEVEPRLRGAEQFEWLDRLDIEHDNIRAVLEWSQGQGRVQRGIRLAGALWQFWVVRTYYREGQESITQLLRQPGAAEKTLARARALYTAAKCAEQQGNYPLSIGYFEEVIAIARELGQVGKKILTLALADLEFRRLQESSVAFPGLEEAWMVGQELGDPWILAHLVRTRGRLLLAQRDYKTARTNFEECIALYRKIGDTRMATIALGELAMLTYREGDYATARLQLEQILPFARQANARRSLLVTSINLGEIARSEGDYSLARQYYEQALAVAQDIGNQFSISVALSNLGGTILRLGEVTQARKLLVDALTIAKQINQGFLIVFALGGLAFVAAAQNQAARAARLFAAFDSLAKLNGILSSDPSPADNAELKHYTTMARAQLDETTFNAAWAEGQKLSLEEAIELALKEAGDE